MSEIDELKHDIEHKKLAVRNRKVTIKELKKDKEMLKSDLNNAYICIGNQSREIESLEDTINELEAQIEKMKCCENCKNNYFLATEEPCYSCTRCYARTTKKTTDKWEIKAND